MEVLRCDAYVYMRNFLLCCMRICTDVCDGVVWLFCDRNSLLEKWLAHSTCWSIHNIVLHRKWLWITTSTHLIGTRPLQWIDIPKVLGRQNHVEVAEQKKYTKYADVIRKCGAKMNGSLQH